MLRPTGTRHVRENTEVPRTGIPGAPNGPAAATNGDRGRDQRSGLHVPTQLAIWARLLRPTLGEPFDLIHVRFVLCHLAGRQQVLYCGGSVSGWGQRPGQRGRTDGERPIPSVRG